MTADDLVTLRALIERHEGRQPKVYLDSKGIPTIGVGRNLRDKGLMPDEIDLLLDHDIAEKTGALTHQFTWFSGLSPARQMALIDLAFMGPEKLLAFVNMIAAIQRQDWQAAADEIARSKWAADVGENRTRDVCALMVTG